MAAARRPARSPQWRYCLKVLLWGKGVRECAGGAVGRKWPIALRRGHPVACVGVPAFATVTLFLPKTKNDVAFSPTRAAPFAVFTCARVRPLRSVALRMEVRAEHVYFVRRLARCVSNVV